jgi:hypothetical protein
MSRNTERENIEGRMAGLVVIKGIRAEEYKEERPQRIAKEGQAGKSKKWRRAERKGTG